MTNTLETFTSRIGLTLLVVAVVPVLSLLVLI